MNLSNLKYCDAIYCPKKLWLDNNFPQLASQSVKSKTNIINNISLLSIAQSFFSSCICIEISSKLDISHKLEATKKALANTTTIVGATFFYEDCLCTIDIFHQENNEVTIYSVKQVSEIKEIYLEELKYQTYILHKLGYNIVKICLLYINTDYIFNEVIDYFKFFHLDDCTYLILSSLNEVKDNINEFVAYLDQQKEPSADLTIKCLTPEKCPFFNYCHSFLQPNNVFNLPRLSAQSKIELYQHGLYTYEMLLKTNLKNTFKLPMYYELYNPSPYINKENILAFFNKMSKDIFFIDITYFQLVVPLYSNSKPYQKIPFQYSVAYLNKTTDSFNYVDYLSKEEDDPRRLLAESLINNIPNNVTLITYNVPLKKELLQGLASLYPDIKKQLLSISNSLQDLMYPFYNYDYYCKEMHDSYLFKDILKALFPNDSKLNYQKLAQVHDDNEACLTYLKLFKSSSKEQLKKSQNLINYVHLNTYALTEIYSFLQNLVK